MKLAAIEIAASLDRVKFINRMMLLIIQGLIRQP